MTTFMTYPSYFGASYNGYVAASGTSFAAPFGTGAVGLLAAVRPELIDTDFQRVLRESAHDLPPAGPDEQTGYGRLDVAHALADVRPSLGLWHDETAADSFVVEAAGLLTVGERSPGTMSAHFGSGWATRVSAYATIALPDSFLDSVRVWPRVGGTFAARGDFSMPYFAPSAEVVRVESDRFVMRGFLYRSLEDSCDTCDDTYVPLAPSNVRFGFSVLGRVDRAPALALAAPAADTALASGESIVLSWSASDVDQVTRVTADLVSAGGAVHRLV